jgi:hypothetical protein
MLVTECGTAWVRERLRKPSQASAVVGFEQLFLHDPDIFDIL